MHRTAATICTAQRSLYIPHSGRYMYRKVVTICTTSLTFTIPRSAHTAVFMCFVWIWEQTAIISLYNINWLVLTTATECVYWAVRADLSLDVVTWNSWHDSVTALVRPSVRPSICLDRVADSINDSGCSLTQNGISGSLGAAVCGIGVL